MGQLARWHQQAIYWAQHKPFYLVIGGGLGLTLSFPPIPLPFLAFVSWVPWFYLWEYARLRYQHLYLSLLIWNVGVAYWLCLTVLGANSLGEAFQNFFAGFLANVLNPILMSIPILLFRYLKKKEGSLYFYFAFVPLWISFEYLHFHWELTWSWLTLGHAFASLPFLVQFIEWTGVYGVSAWILLVNVVIFLVLHQPSKSLKMWLLAVVALPVMLSMGLLWPARSAYQVEKTWNVRVIQPNIDPYQKFEATSEASQIAMFTQMYAAKGIDTMDLVVLPETAIPFGISSRYAEDSRLSLLLEAVQKHKVPLLTGCSEYKVFDNDVFAPPTARQYGSQWIQFYNAATVIGDSSGEFYEKSKLVPFVERVPYYETLKGLQEVIQIDLGGGFGNYGLPDSIFCLDGKTSNEIGNAICYESIFPHHIRELVRKGAKFISVITNDGWWGQSSGYLQHAYYARLRAIETRREVIRCANTGLSMHIDNQGNILYSTGWWQRTFFDAKVRHYRYETIYVRWGDWWCVLSMVVSLGVIMMPFIRSFNKQ